MQRPHVHFSFRDYKIAAMDNYHEIVNEKWCAMNLFTKTFYSVVRLDKKLVPMIKCTKYAILFAKELDE